MLFGIQLEKTSTGFFFAKILYLICIEEFITNSQVAITCCFIKENIMKKMKKDLVDVLSSKIQMEKDEITQIVDKVLDGIKEILSEGSSLEIRGFGTFEVKIRKGKKNARNPKNGEKVETKPHYVVSFKPGIELKENLKKLELPE